MKVLEKLHQIKAPHFTAGLVTREGKVVDAAPILQWTLGKPEIGVLSYCRRKRWTMEMISATKVQV
jgi:hypothetical protein